MPSEAGAAGAERTFEVLPELKAVSDYTGLNLLEVLQLPCDLFQGIYRRYVIDKLNTTQQGRDYLQECQRLNTTDLTDETFDKITELFA